MNLALALASAGLLILIHPGPDVSWLAWIALAPIVYACSRQPRWQRRFLLGWAAGIVYWFVHCNWIQFVLEFHGGMGRWGGWGTFLLFCVLKAIHLGVFASLAGWLTGRWWSPLAVAAAWVGLERTHGTFGFAWLALGNAGIDMGLLTAAATITGVYGLSFLFALSGAAVAALRPKQLLWCTPVVLAFLPAVTIDSPPAETAAVIQPNFDEEHNWTREETDLMHRRLTTASLETALKNRARLIIWPEAPAPIYYLNDPRFRQYADDLARTAQAWFLFGSVTFLDGDSPLNSAVLLTPAGQLVDRYDKMYLVPFGEFVPSVFGFVNKVTKEAGNYVPGQRVVAFPFGEQKLGVFICYESAFPHLVRQFASAGASAFVNISNDGYFGRSYAREQHLKLVRMRALENRRWIVRSTNDGITAAVNPNGRITERLEPFKEAAAAMRFGYVKSLTPYSRYGDWFAWTALAAAIATAAAQRRVRR